jgi:hypothetical protein
MDLVVTFWYYVVSFTDALLWLHPLVCHCIRNSELGMVDVTTLYDTFPDVTIINAVIILTGFQSWITDPIASIAKICNSFLIV